MGLNILPYIVLLASLLLGGVVSSGHAAVLDDTDWDELQDSQESAQAAPAAQKKTVQPGRKPEKVRRTNTYFGMGYERRMQSLGASGVVRRRGGRGGRGR